MVARSSRCAVTLWPLVALLIFAADRSQAQGYGINWFTIDGGGSASAGGTFSLSGTIGQPDAGAMAGGNYSITGGFWAIESVVLPGVPRLFIIRSGGNVLISWTPAIPGFVLQGNGSASSLGWADAPSGSTNPASVLAAGAARFYRLRKP